MKKLQHQQLGLWTLFFSGKHLAFGVVAAILVFSAYTILLLRLPGEVQHACVLGGGFVPLNIGFSAVFSLVSGVLAMGLMEIGKRRANHSLSSGLTGIFSFLVGILTAFCVVCVAPIVGIFGFSFGLSFFVENGPLFQSLSLSMMLYSLWLMHQHLKDCGCVLK